MSEAVKVCHYEACPAKAHIDSLFRDKENFEQMLKRIEMQQTKQNQLLLEQKIDREAHTTLILNHVRELKDENISHQQKVLEKLGDLETREKVSAFKIGVLWSAIGSIVLAVGGVALLYFKKMIGV